MIFCRGHWRYNKVMDEEAWHCQSCSDRQREGGRQEPLDVGWSIGLLGIPAVHHTQRKQVRKMPCRDCRHMEMHASLCIIPRLLSGDDPAWERTLASHSHQRVARPLISKWIVLLGLEKREMQRERESTDKHGLASS